MAGERHVSEFKKSARRGFRLHYLLLYSIPTMQLKIGIYNSAFGISGWPVLERMETILIMKILPILLYLTKNIQKYTRIYVVWYVWIVLR